MINCGYFFGLGWILCCKLLNSEDSTYNFLNYTDYGLEDADHSRLSVVGIYFAFTSLSTVGFGDYAPRSDIERVLGAFIMLSGVAIFSTIMEQLLDMMFQLKEFNKSLDEGDKLFRFFGVCKKFNNNNQIDQALKKRIENHFKYKWKNDKNSALNSIEDKDIFMQIPSEI